MVRRDQRPYNPCFDPHVNKKQSKAQIPIRACSLTDLPNTAVGPGTVRIRAASRLFPTDESSKIRVEAAKIHLSQGLKKRFSGIVELHFCAS
jgi:hypothetical protein